VGYRIKEGVVVESACVEHYIYRYSDEGSFVRYSRTRVSVDVAIVFRECIDPSIVTRADDTAITSYLSRHCAIIVQTFNDHGSRADFVFFAREYAGEAEGSSLHPRDVRYDREPAQTRDLQDVYGEIVSVYFSFIFFKLCDRLVFRFRFQLSGLGANRSKQKKI